MHRTPLQVRDYPKTLSYNDLIMCWPHSVMSFLISASPTFHRARRRLLILIFRSKKVTSVPRGNHRRKLHTTAVLLILCQYSWPKISVMDLEVMKRKWLVAEIAVCVSKVQNTRVCEPKHFEPRRLDFTRRCFPKCVRTRRYTIAGEVYLLAIPFISLVVAQLAQ